jgi:hypothetical protein
MVSKESREFYIYAYYDEMGVTRYVGKGSGRRWIDHIRYAHNPRLRALIKRMGDAVDVRKLHERLTHDEAVKMEVEIIASIGRGKNGPLFNFTDGGEGSYGRPQSEDGRRRISEARKGSKHTPEARAKMSASRKGVALSDAHRAAISAGNKGKVISEAHKRAVGDKHRGSRLSEDHKAKIGAGIRGRPQSPNQIRLRIERSMATKRKKMDLRVMALGLPIF